MTAKNAESTAKKPETRRLLVATTIEAALLLLALAAMTHLLAERQTVATLLASGAGAAGGDLALAGGFILLRFVTVLTLPALLAYRTVRLVQIIAMRRRQ